jgi:subtilisin family serine protease
MSHDNRAADDLNSLSKGETTTQKTEEDPSRDSQWAPGVIHVEFQNPEIGEQMIAACASGAKLNETNTAAQLLKIFQTYKLLDCEPTFPISDETSTDPEEAHRRRFITFYFQPSENLATNAVKELRALSYVARASAMPRLAPPRTALLPEPLLGQVGPMSFPSVNCGAFRADSPKLDKQWYIFRSHIDEAWTLRNPPLSGTGVVLADLDWGFRTNHNDLKGRIEKTFNTVTNNVGVSNGNKLRHGTAVLGMAGAALNGLGIAGIANQASLWAIQAGDDVNGVDVTKEFKSWVAAIDLIRKTNCEGRRKVLMLECQTLAEGNAEMAIPINQAIVDAINANVVVCVAAGNRGRDANIGDDHLDITRTGSVLVGATDFDPNPTINRRGKSNFGPRVTVYAPGDRRHDLTCSNEGSDKYTNCFGGTSGATAKVGGVVALMLEANPELTQEQIEGILRHTGSPITDDQDPKGKFLNASEAVREAIALVQPKS